MEVRGRNGKGKKKWKEVAGKGGGRVREGVRQEIVSLTVKYRKYVLIQCVGARYCSLLQWPNRGALNCTCFLGQREL